MKDDARKEMTAAGDTRIGVARVWLGPGSPRSIEPLLAGLGIELLAPPERERATLRVEAIPADDRSVTSTERLRIEHVGRGTRDGGETVTWSNSRSPRCGRRRAASSRRRSVFTRPC